jgi:hypothetical protein
MTGGTRRTVMSKERLRTTAVVLSWSPPLPTPPRAIMTVVDMLRELRQAAAALEQNLADEQPRRRLRRSVIRPLDQARAQLTGQAEAAAIDPDPAPPSDAAAGASAADRVWRWLVGPPACGSSTTTACPSRSSRPWLDVIGAVLSRLLGGLHARAAKSCH